MNKNNIVKYIDNLDIREPIIIDDIDENTEYLIIFNIIFNKLENDIKNFQMINNLPIKIKVIYIRYTNYEIIDIINNLSFNRNIEFFQSFKSEDNKGNIIYSPTRTYSNIKYYTSMYPRNKINKDELNKNI